MALIHFSLEHRRSLPEAQAKLEQSVAELERSLAGLVQRVEWTQQGRDVLLAGTGFEIMIRVDERAVHVEGDIPLVAKLFGSPLLSGMKKVLQRTFDKRLEG